MKNKAASSECVKVAVRVRPMNKKEKEENSTICVSINSDDNTVSVSSSKNETKTFQFDYVFGMESTQREVYDKVAFPIVDGIFQGYNGTVFAYGQTGCGKTFTMMGDIKDEQLKGVIPNAFQHIFGYIGAEGEKKKFIVRCSFVEIYNEEVRDLLSNSSKQLAVREDPKKGTYVQDLSFTFLTNSQEIINCLDKGNNNRHVGATSMNAKSSRSHSLFTVYVEIQEGEGKEQKIRTGKLNLVDLAGSERVSKTNATGQTFDEGKKINLSLTALGSVIDALSSNRKHIPYKDSKLTRLLSDSLGGNSRTIMFANCSPASYNYEETVGTLRYASRAKLIKNSPKINEDPKDALLRKYEEEIKLLKSKLEGNGNIQTEIKTEGGEVKEVIKEVVVQKEMDSEEREALLAKIAQLEKGVIAGGDELPSPNLGGVKEKKRNEEAEKERQKFHEYRMQQLKNNQEMEERYEKLKEEKLKEEESLNNDLNNLKLKVKQYKSEIEEMRLDNQKDRQDFLESVKDSQKDIALYKGMVEFLMTMPEVKKIIKLSKYDDVDQKWTIHPFYFKEKEISFPSIGFSKPKEFINCNLNKKESLEEKEEIDSKSEKRIQIKRINIKSKNVNESKEEPNIEKIKINPKEIKEEDNIKLKRINISENKKIKRIEINTNKKFKINNEPVSFEKLSGSNSNLPLQGLQFGNKKEEEFPKIQNGSGMIALPKINIGPPFRERKEEDEINGKGKTGLKKVGKKILNPVGLKNT